MPKSERQYEDMQVKNQKHRGHPAEQSSAKVRKEESKNPETGGSPYVGATGQERKCEEYHKAPKGHGPE